MAESKQELRAMQTEVKAMKANMQTAAKGMAAFGAAVTAAFALAVKGTVEAGHLEGWNGKHTVGY